MARADSGGFDLILELSMGALTRQLAPAVAAANGDTNFPVANWGTLVFHNRLTLGPLRLSPDATVSMTLSSAGTGVSWPDLWFGGIRVIAAGTAPFSFDVTVGMQPASSGTSLTLRFPPGSAEVRVNPGTLESVPGVQAWLAAVDLAQGHAAREAERLRLYTAAQASLSDALNAALPDELPIGTLPSPPVRAVEFAASGDELRVLMTIGGSRGFPAQITRSAIRRSPSGTPLDLAGIVVGNTCLLRDLLRPVLAGGLGLPAAGFSAGHPCSWSGSVALPVSVAGITPMIRSVRAGTDAAGMIHALITLDGDHPTGAYGITGSLDLSFGASITGTGATRALTLTLGTSVVSSLDVHIAAWVYAAAAFGIGSPLLIAALAITDGVAGPALAGAVNAGVTAALGSTGSLALPLPAGGLGPTSLSMAQPDSALRVLTVLGTVTIPEFPMNDVIATIG